MKKGVIVSGYFNPIHVGHIEYFKEAKKHGDQLIVIVNNDFQRELKGSYEFMNQDERFKILENISLVDRVYLSIDKDRTVIKTIRKIYNELHSEFDLIFANGGDQNNSSIPEKEICNALNIKLIDKLGDKIQSSSWLLNKQNENK